jgi:hypothetical protein
VAARADDRDSSGTFVRSGSEDAKGAGLSHSRVRPRLVDRLPCGKPRVNWLSESGGLPRVRLTMKSSEATPRNAGHTNESTELGAVPLRGLFLQVAGPERSGAVHEVMRGGEAGGSPSHGMDGRTDRGDSGGYSLMVTGTDRRDVEGHHALDCVGTRRYC